METSPIETLVRGWLDDDKSDHSRLAILVDGVSVVCRSTEIGGYLWHTGRLTLPDMRTFRIAWSQATDLVVVGKRVQ
jgi:hypothetical protein